MPPRIAAISIVVLFLLYEVAIAVQPEWMIATKDHRRGRAVAGLLLLSSGAIILSIMVDMRCTVLEAASSLHVPIRMR